MSILVIGETVVDLIRKAPPSEQPEAECFCPHSGGTGANVAIAAARLGARVALASGVGNDNWGQWLTQRLRAEGVSLKWFERAARVSTPVSLVTVDSAGEPSLRMYGEDIRRTIETLEHRFPMAVSACDCLYLASNTLVGERERRITLAARQQAVEEGKAVVFDANLRLDRWENRSDAISVCLTALRGTTLVKCNHAEAALLTGEQDAQRAGDALVRAGAASAVVTLGPEGACLRGPRNRDMPGVQARVVSTLGAGDTLVGVLLARLALGGFDQTVLPDALPEAVRTAAATTERWGAVSAPIHL
jgi:sugar/nucleoside kinase (ribokinase family)